MERDQSLYFLFLSEILILLCVLRVFVVQFLFALRAFA